MTGLKPLLLIYGVLIFVASSAHMFAETIGRLSVIRRETRDERSMTDGSRRTSTLRCGDKMKSSNVHPRANSSIRAPTVLSIRGNADMDSYYRHTGTTVPLREIEALLRDRLAKTLPGIEAQIRFAPELLKKACPGRRGRSVYAAHRLWRQESTTADHSDCLAPP